jgi:predicted Rossmann fold flavoprotein
MLSDSTLKGKIIDLIVIGAGPAGLMAAISAASRGACVLLLEGESSSGKKLLITGGGHCNITNCTVSERDFYSDDPRTVRNVLRVFPVSKTGDFFRTQGLSLTADEDGKMFPQDRKAVSVLGTLLRIVRERKVTLLTRSEVLAICYRHGIFTASGKGFSFSSKAVIVATGGLSYPTTGSRGAGYEIAKAFGHSIVAPSPALVPFETADADWRGLAGITLETVLELFCHGRRLAESRGPLLFTHQGFSGPAVMNLASPWARFGGQGTLAICANFLPQVSEQSLRERLQETTVAKPAMTIKKFLSHDIPERLAGVLLQKSGIVPEKQLANFPKKERELLFRVVRSCVLPVRGPLGYDRAEVTAGGISLKEVNPKTLESNIVPGLFFAGEVLEVDGRIGGFNLQWAWSSGYVAGCAATEKLGQPIRS